MKTIRIKAVYIGNDVSLGYKHGWTYRLKIRHYKDKPICIETIEGKGYCEYETLFTFFKDWDLIENDYI